MPPARHNFDLNTVVSRVTLKSIILEFASIIRQSPVTNSPLVWVCFSLAKKVARGFQPIKTVRFEDERTTSAKFYIKFFRILSKNSHQGMLHCTCFHQKS